MKYNQSGYKNAKNLVAVRETGKCEKLEVVEFEKQK